MRTVVSAAGWVASDEAVESVAGEPVVQAARARTDAPRTGRIQRERTRLSFNEGMKHIKSNKVRDARATIHRSAFESLLFPLISAK